MILGQTALSMAAEKEKIVDFHSLITVHPDASMTVSETIRVICARDQIKRGIIREFPTTYKDHYGNRVKVGFEVLEVLRDGRREAYHIKDASNGKKVYIGRKNVQLKPGTYTYTITYKTNRQLGYFDDFDELYWNVTGNGWSFAIEHASAVVKLPPGAEILDTAGYTGAYGSNRKDFITDFDEAGNVTFETTGRLRRNEGLTIAVSWPKGFVAEPTSPEKIAFLIKDNRSGAIGVIGFFTLLAYYTMAWFRVGKDPDKGAIIPLFTPPKNISPALARLIMRLGWKDDKLLAVAVVNMAVKGYLTITEDEEGEYTLNKKGNNAKSLSRGESATAGLLFKFGRSIQLKQTKDEEVVEAFEKLFKSGRSIKPKKNTSEQIGEAEKKLHKLLSLEAHQKYFQLNSGYFIAGVIITLIALVGIILGTGQQSQLVTALFLCLWLSIWTIGCIALGAAVYNAWKGLLKPDKGIIKGTGTAIGITLFSVPFFAGEIFGLGMFAWAVSPLAMIALLLIILVNAFFYHLLKAPTLTGRNIMDQIEGFKLFLSVAEKDRLNFRNPPDRTPELFERYLPYALALGVEQQWSEQFADVLSAAARGDNYKPAWYSGHNWDSRNIGGFSSNLGSSFTGAISSASTAPGSSSGSGGGGFSGGGGGGGGGSGW
jgi:uncharacterized membrane protein YgcG